MSPTPVDPRVELGRRIQAERRKHKLTPEGLAAACELDLSNIRKIERGTGNPTFETLLRITGTLEIELSDLVKGIDPYALPDGKRPKPRPLRDFPDTFWRPKDHERSA